MMNNTNERMCNLILDMDGVLWHGQTPVPGLTDFFETLKELRINFVLATNNATRLAHDYAGRLSKFGVNVQPNRILTSAEATALYLKKERPGGAVVYVIGEKGLYEAIRNQGNELIDEQGLVPIETRADFVVAGMTRHVCYDQLASACYLINHGAAFIGTNPDVTFPTEVGPLPGAGSILAFLQTATGIEPTVIGKPSKAIFDEAIERLGGNHDDTIMVGDRLNTDVLGGHNAGLRTVLLLSGISTMDDVTRSPIKPTWIFDNLVDFTAFLLDDSKA